MQIKKVIYEKLISRLEYDIVGLNHKRNRNKREIKKLADEQVAIKQEQTVLVSLIREIKGKVK